MLIALFNGPPGCGKDYLTNRMFERNPALFARHKMSKILKERTHALYGMADKPWDAYEGAVKDQPLPEFLGKTPRQAYIAVSELLMKPFHGDDVLGQFMVQVLQSEQPDKIVTISDSGFSREAMPLIDNFGADAVILFRIHMDGKDFSGDSRSYISLSGIETHDVRNIHGRADEAIDQISRIITARLDHNPYLLSGRADHTPRCA